MKFVRLNQLALAALLSACGGGLGTPNGPVVGSPGSPNPPPTQLVKVRVTISIPGSNNARKVRPGYVSPNTQSVVIQLVSVNGQGVTGVNATTIETFAGASNCKAQGKSTTCTGTTSGSPGDDVFSVTTYAGQNATGAVLSVGTVDAHVAKGGSGVSISNLSLALAGVIASLQIALTPSGAKRGKPARSSLTLVAFDASGAQIVGPSDYASPIDLTVQGDNLGAFRLHAGGTSGQSLIIVKPTSGITLTYDGNPRASTISVQASVNGPSSIGASARFTLRGKQPPPPVGTIYALNLGSNDGQAATVTEYDGKAKGNAAPKRTLNLSSKLFARSIAVDSSGNLYVGLFDNQLGFSPSNGTPDAGNVVDIYAPGASGNAKPSAVLTADPKSGTTIFPLFMTFDLSGDLVTYGATNVDNNNGDAVLTYPPGSQGAAAPAHGWNFATPRIQYAGPTGLALDASGNFYVNGALHTSLGPSYGLFVAPVSDVGNPQTPPSRTIPWDTTTQLTPGLTTNVGLDPSGEVFIANSLVQGGSSSTTCQGRVNVFAAGPSSGFTDVPPLRVLTLGDVLTNNYVCNSQRDPRVPFFPSIATYGTLVFAADDFNNAIHSYPGDHSGKVAPTLTISGSATQLNAPVALVVSSLSGPATAGPAHHRFVALHAQ